MAPPSPLGLPSAVASAFGKAPVPQPTLLTVHLANVTAYYQDTVALATLASLPQAPINTATLAKNNFFPLEVVADIVQINDDNTVKGLYLSKNLVTKSGHDASGTTAPQGTAISDASITGFRHDIYKILNSDYTEVGSIMAAGVSGQPIAPGGPLELLGGDWTITGGTGAFLGVAGQMGGQGGAGGGGGTIRAASVTEDPSQRRILANSTNITTMFLYLIPNERPQIVAIFHAPSGNQAPTPVTPAHPARPNDQLLLYATGLGPVTPNVPIGQPFPSNAAPAVTSPVTITVGNAPAITIAPGNALGYPGYANGYSVLFAMPAGVSGQNHPRTASIQITAAWIPSAPATIDVP